VSARLGDVRPYGEVRSSSSRTDALASCPHLQVRQEQVSALCVPVTVLGTSTGVIHLTGPTDEPLDTAQRARAEVLAIQTGARLGLLRALVTSEIAATTDSLTGQLNRRSLEEALRRLDDEQIPYAVAFADLDNFKLLNDTHGHAAGDRALRHFSTVTGATVRTGDMVSRFGGEEFLLVYVGCDATEAAPIVHRPARCSGGIGTRRGGAAVHRQHRPGRFHLRHHGGRDHRLRRCRVDDGETGRARPSDYRGEGRSGGGRHLLGVRMNVAMSPR